MNAIMAKRKLNPWTPAKIRELGDALAERFDWTQTDMAEEIGVGQGVWSAWQSGKRKPSRQSLILLDFLNAKLGTGKVTFPKKK